MTNKEKKQAIKEVLQFVKTGKQDLLNGVDEIEFINQIFLSTQNFELKRSDLIENKKNILINEISIFDFKETSITTNEVNKAKQIVFIDNNKELKILKYI